MWFKPNQTQNIQFALQPHTPHYDPAVLVNDLWFR